MGKKDEYDRRTLAKKKNEFFFTAIFTITGGNYLKIKKRSKISSYYCKYVIQIIECFKLFFLH